MKYEFVDQQTADFYKKWNLYTWQMLWTIRWAMRRSETVRHSNGDMTEHLRSCFARYYIVGKMEELAQAQVCEGIGGHDELPHVWQ
jgi:hypothetical protein